VGNNRSLILEKYLTSLSGKEQFDILYNLPMGLRIWFEGSFMKRKVLGGAAATVPRALQNAKKLIDLLGLRKKRPTKLYRLVSIPREQDCEKYARMKNKIIGVSKNDYQSWSASKQAAEKFFKDVYQSHDFKTGSSRWVFMIVEGSDIQDSNIIASYPEIINLLQVLRDYIKGLPQQRYDQIYLPGVELDKRMIFSTIHYTLKDLSRKWYANQQEVITHIPSKKVRVSQTWVLQCDTPTKQQKGRLQELIEAEVEDYWHSDGYTHRGVKRPAAPDTSKFDMTAFSKLTHSRQMVDYAKSTLGTPLGSGSSRIVYRLPNKKTVLKIAWDGDREDGIDAGMAQNRAEATASDFSKGSFFTNVLQKGPQYKWIISEYARPVRDEMEFKMLSGGLDHETFDELTYIWDKYRDTPDKEKVLLDRYKEVAATIKNNKWFADFLKFMQVGNILPGDFHGENHWGVVESPSGSKRRLVVLDYGYTIDTKEEFYNWEE